MNGNEQLGELLLRWDERREAGDEPSAAELCDGDQNLAAELIEIRWRSRTAHFRGIEITAESLVPAG